jgi:hypothetical protein
MKFKIILIQFQQFMEIISLNKTVRALGAQTRIVDFIEIDFSAQIYFAVVLYSVISNVID